jgi:hypothetical protein
VAEVEVPASIGQRLLWVLDHYRGHEGALNCPVLCRIRGPLDTDALAGALADLTERHASLRTTFRGRGPRLVQLVHDPRPVPLDRRDLTGTPDPEEAVRRELDAELARRIDPVTWPVRTTLWRLAPDHHVLCLNVHHLVTDAWSCPLLFRDLFRLYERRTGFAADVPPPAGWPFPRFGAWQQEQLAIGAMRAHQAYWRRQLAGVTLPALPGRGDGGPRRAARETADIDAGVAKDLRRIAQDCRATTFATMLSVHYAVLHALTGQDDLAVASLFANRARPELAETVGFLANMVVLRTRLPASATFARTVRAAHFTVVGAMTHQDVPYQLLALPALRSGTARADDVVFQVMAEPVYATRFGDLDVAALVPEGVGSRFDLELALVPTGMGYRAVLFYDAARFEPAFARDVVKHYAEVAAAAAAEPDAPLTALSR